MKHYIDCLHFEMHCSDEKNAFGLREMVAVSIYPEVLKIIDEVCSEFTVEDELLRLDTIEIDLGKVTSSLLRRDFASTFRAAFEKEMAKQASGISARQRLLLMEQSKMELIVQFLLHGTLSWWSGAEQVDVDRLVRELCRRYPGQMRSFFSGERANKALWSRAVMQLNDTSKRLLISLFPALTEAERQIRDRITSFEPVVGSSGSMVVTEDAIRNIVLVHAPELLRVGNGAMPEPELIDDLVRSASHRTEREHPEPEVGVCDEAEESGKAITELDTMLERFDMILLQGADSLSPVTDTPETNAGAELDELVLELYRRSPGELRRYLEGQFDNLTLWSRVVMQLSDDSIRLLVKLFPALAEAERQIRERLSALEPVAGRSPSAVISEKSIRNLVIRHAPELLRVVSGAMPEPELIDVLVRSASHRAVREHPEPEVGVRDEAKESGKAITEMDTMLERFGMILHSDEPFSRAGTDSPETNAGAELDKLVLELYRRSPGKLRRYLEGQFDNLTLWSRVVMQLSDDSIRLLVKLFPALAEAERQIRDRITASEPVVGSSGSMVVSEEGIFNLILHHAPELLRDVSGAMPEPELIDDLVREVYQHEERTQAKPESEESGKAITELEAIQERFDKMLLQGGDSLSPGTDSAETNAGVELDELVRELYWRSPGELRSHLAGQLDNPVLWHRVAMQLSGETKRLLVTLFPALAEAERQIRDRITSSEPVVGASGSMVVPEEPIRNIVLGHAPELLRDVSGAMHEPGLIDDLVREVYHHEERTQAKPESEESGKAITELDTIQERFDKMLLQRGDSLSPGTEFPETNAGAEFDDLVREVYRQSPGELRSFLAGQRDNATLWHRVVMQLSDGSKRLLVTLLPALAEAERQIRDRIEAQWAVDERTGSMVVPEETIRNLILHHAPELLRVGSGARLSSELIDDLVREVYHHEERTQAEAASEESCKAITEMDTMLERFGMILQSDEPFSREGTDSPEPNAGAELDDLVRELYWRSPGKLRSHLAGQLDNPVLWHRVAMQLSGETKRLLVTLFPALAEAERQIRDRITSSEPVVGASGSMVVPEEPIRNLILHHAPELLRDVSGAMPEPGLIDDLVREVYHHEERTQAEAASEESGKAITELDTMLERFGMILQSDEPFSRAGTDFPETNAVAELDKLVLELYRQSPGKLRRFLAGQFDNLTLWSRVVMQLSDDTKRLIIKLFNPLLRTGLRLSECAEHATEGKVRFRTPDLFPRAMLLALLRYAPEILHSAGDKSSPAKLPDALVDEAFPEWLSTLIKRAASPPLDVEAGSFKNTDRGTFSGSQEIAANEMRNKEIMQHFTHSGQQHFSDTGRDVEERYVVRHSGIIIVSPFFKPFFQACGLLDGNAWKHNEAQYQAVHLLKYLSTGQTRTPEFALVLEKLCCGMALDEPVPVDAALRQEQLDEADSLLASVIGHWRALKNTSINGLRENFLKRDGILRRKENGWLLQVERKTLDVLLDSVPWGYSSVVLPWNSYLINVEW